jgi:mono/diheme cytochrome c family protein
VRATLVVACATAILGLAACESLPGKPAAAKRYVRPTDVTDFDTLYVGNCAGCHGDGERPGAALALADPVYLALAPDAAMRWATALGVAGTAMPAFATSAGGPLTEAQIDTIVHGLRRRWGSPEAVTTAPAYSAPLGDAERGRDAYATYCASCHGADGRGGPKGGSVVDGSYLSLISDQGLRSIVLAGRPGLGMPDFRSYVTGRPMHGDEVADVVAWLASQRPRYPGQPYARTQTSQETSP